MSILWADGGPVYPAGLNPWSATGTNVAPGYTYFTPGVAPSAQEFNALFNQTTCYSQSTSSVVTLRAMPAPSVGGMCQVLNFATSFVGSAAPYQLGLYAWSANSTAVDDGVAFVKPSSVSGAGRWILQRGPLITVQDQVIENTAGPTVSTFSSSPMSIGTLVLPGGLQVNDVIDVELLVQVQCTTPNAGISNSGLTFLENGSLVGFTTPCTVFNNTGSSQTTSTVYPMKHRHVATAPDVSGGLVITVNCGNLSGNGNQIFTNAYSRLHVRRP